MSCLTYVTLFFLVLFLIANTVFSLMSYWREEAMYSNLQAPHDHKIIFALCIGLSIYMIVCFVFFIMFTRSYVFIALFYVIPIGILSSVVAMTSPYHVNKVIAKVSDDWTLENSEVFQITNMCCGWEANNTTESLSPCPFEFDIGCKSVVTSKLQGYFHQIMVSFAIILGGFAITIPVLYIENIISGSESILDSTK